MKARSNFYRVVSAILTLTMLLSLLPLQIFAVDPSTLEPDAIFKNMQLIGAVSHLPISTSYSADVTQDPPDSEPRNYVYNSVAANPNTDDPNPLDWMLLAYSIQYSQDVDLELYELNVGAADWENRGSDPETLKLPFRVEEDPENPDEALEPEDFLGTRLGYLKVYPYEHNYNGPDAEGHYAYDERFTQEDLFEHVMNVMLGDLSGATSLAGYRAVGFDGLPLIRDGEVVSLEDEALDETATAPETPTDEPEAPAVTDTQEPEVTEPMEPAAPVEDTDTAEPNEVEDNEEVDAALPGTEESTEDTATPTDNPSAEAVPTEPEVNEAEPTETPEPTTEPEAEDPADEPEEAPVPTQEPADEKPAPVEESENEPMAYADAPSMDGKIQNFSVWGGELSDNPGFRFTDGYYVIVLTPKDELNQKYNSFICFRVDTSAQPVEMLCLEEYMELMEICSEDPVNMLNGSFSWNYTDVSLYGKYDLPFTRYYESADSQRDHGLGRGWSTDYSVELQIDTLYAKVTLPGGKDIYFDMFYDGTYRSKAGSAFTFERLGDGYKLSHKDGTAYYFNGNQQLTRISYLDGNFYNIAYNGDLIASVTSPTGTLTFTDDGSHITSVADGNGRTITLTYNGEYLASVTNTDGDSLLYEYDANGHLTNITNFNNEIYVSNTYDNAGRVVSQYLADRGTQTFTYDDAARRNTCEGEGGYYLSIVYDRFGRIIESSNSVGTRYFEYNELNQRVSDTDYAGNRTYYEHDSAGNISKVTYPDGLSESYVYNADNQIVSKTDRNGHTVFYTYDGNNNLTGVTDAKGNEVSYTYDAARNMTGYTDALGQTVSYTYDSKGNCTSMTDEKGNTTTYVYDAQGRMTSATDAMGATTSYEYTEAGKLVKITDAQGNVQTYTVDGNGFNTSQSDWMGNITTYAYDTQNNLTAVTDPLGNTTSYTYDAAGNLTVTTDANGNTTSYTYDGEGRVISMTNAAGGTTTYNYDANGNLTGMTDAQGGTVTMTYNSVQQQTAVTDARGGTTSYVYDGVGNTTKVTDALGKSTSYVYDANGNLVSVTDRTGAKTEYTYDANNRVTSVKDGNGNVTTYTYDATGNVTKTTSALGNENTATYDKNGRQLSSKDAMGAVTKYTYDSLGRVTAIQFADSTTVAYTYDANGNVLTATDTLGGVTSYTYDNAGRMLTMTDPMGNVTSYTYDAMGNVLTVTDPMGLTTTYTYNALNQVASVTDPGNHTTGYAYNAAGNVTVITDALGHTVKFGYDAAGQMTSMTDANGGVTRYAYDKLGRVVSVTDANGNKTTFAYDNEGRQTSETDALGYASSKTFDKVGNVLTETDKNGNTWTYTYDADYRMTSSTDPLGNTTTYTYDANGNVLSETSPMGSTSSYTYDNMGQVTGTMDALGHTATFLYDDAGRVVSVTNCDATNVAYTYDANGNLLTSTDELGNTVTYAYDADNRMTFVTDAMGGITAYTYDACGNIITETNAMGGVTKRSYDAAGNLTSVTDPMGNKTQYAYDGNGNVTSITDANGGVMTAEYDANGNIVKITDAGGNETTYTYDAMNQLISYTDAEGYTNSFVYDGNGNIVSRTDGNGNTTTYVYDGLNRATSMTNAEGNVSTNEYDADGRMVKAINTEGAVTSYTYDKVGRLLSMTDALGHVTSFEYDSMDRVTKVTDALSNSTTFEYDAVGNVTKQTNAKGVDTTYTYDANGNNLTVTDAAGTVTYTYDALNRVTTVTDRKGNTQKFTYDGSSRITSVTDRNGNKTEYAYDGNGNIIKTTDAMGTEVLFEYDLNDNLVKMTQNRVDEYHEQSETMVTVYEYDGRNLVTKQVTPAGNAELYVYDGNGNMTQKTDGDGYVTQYSYSALDLVSTINYNGTKEVTYQYNKEGELVRMDDWLGTTTFEVDLLGQLKKVTDHKGETVSYEYDAVGNQTSLTYPDETVVNKTYDELGQLTKVVDAEKESYTYTYDDAGNVTKLTYPNGWVEDYTYDAEGNLLKTVDTDPFHNNKKATKYEYQYDAEGNLTSEYKRATTAHDNPTTTTYTYDALNRIASAHEQGIGVNSKRNYEYDSLGNLIRVEQDGCDEYLYNGTELDQYKQCGVIPNSIGTSYWEYTYDKRGNLTGSDKYTRTTEGMKWQNVANYVYDETNRMVEGRNEQGEYSLYTYNGLGVRVGRELIMKDNTHGYTDFHDLTPSVSTDIDKPEVVKESYVVDYTTATRETLTMHEEGGFDYRWVHGLDRLSVKITSEGTNWWGQNVKQDILKDYTHQDRMGSTTNMTDKFGRIVGRADYNEWGEITYKEALSITSAYRRIYPEANYTGHDWDDVLGMFYAKARFYDPAAKRFVAMDPVKGNVTDPMSLVPYIYCVDNPLKYVDPLGLLKVDNITINSAVEGNVLNRNFSSKDTYIHISDALSILARMGIYVNYEAGPKDAPFAAWTYSYGTMGFAPKWATESYAEKYYYNKTIQLPIVTVSGPEYTDYFIKLDCLESLIYNTNRKKITITETNDILRKDSYLTQNGRHDALNVIKSIVGNDPTSTYNHLLAELESRMMQIVPMEYPALQLSMELLLSELVGAPIDAAVYATQYGPFATIAFFGFLGEHYIESGLKAGVGGSDDLTPEDLNDYVERANNGQFPMPMSTVLGAVGKLLDAKVNTDPYKNISKAIASYLYIQKSYYRYLGSYFNASTIARDLKEKMEEKRNEVGLLAQFFRGYLNEYENRIRPVYELNLKRDNSIYAIKNYDWSDPNLNNGLINDAMIWNEYQNIMLGQGVGIKDL